MFSKQTYIERRKRLSELVGSGLIVLMGNNDASCNYPANVYKFRQDSSFLYYFGQEREGLAGVIDIDNQQEYLFGDDIDIDDIIWTGYVPSVKDLGEEVGVTNSGSMADFAQKLQSAKQSGQAIHFPPPYRNDIKIRLGDILGLHPLALQEASSLKLIKAIVSIRAIKTDEEVAEIEKALSVGYEMHTTAMKLCKPGVTEKYVAGILEGVAHSKGFMTSFPTILSMHGEIQHGYPSTRPMEAGRLMLCDCGAESFEHYASDNTRVTPISGKFTPQQLDIYQIVEACHDHAIEIAKPGIKWYDVHMSVARLMTEMLQQIGLMKGDIDESVAAGAHAMFFPHGLGHMMGMDVHDMENLGQIYVGFDDEVRPSTQFGTNCLRCGRRLQPGFVMTDEPGIYFIPHLIDLWESQGMHKDFICYNKLSAFRDFGGVRLEDDLLITETGNRVLGEKIIPYHPKDVEEFIKD